MEPLESVSKSNQVPVFPLPGVVFFPHTVLPLHVFEPRYRALVRDATAGEGLIAISLLCPGWEQNYEGSPEFHRIGTVGRIEDLSSLPDGRFLLRLVGLQRVEFGQVIREHPYRLVRVRPLAETPVDDDSAEIRAAKLDLLASLGCLLRELKDGKADSIVLDERIPLEAAINGACANLPTDPALRQSLLTENDLFRRLHRVSEQLNEMLHKVLRLKAERADKQRGGLN